MTRTIFAALVALLLPLGGAGATFAADYQISASSDEPVIYFTRLHHRVADVDDHQSLSVFADGRVRVHTPVYMKNAGTYEYVLSSKALQALMTRLDGNGLMSRDWSKAKVERNTQAAMRNVSGDARFHVSDLTATHIVLKFEQFGKSSEKAKPLAKTIVWNNIPDDARQFANNQAIQELAVIEKTLLALTDHSRRQAVRVNGGQ